MSITKYVHVQKLNKYTFLYYLLIICILIKILFTYKENQIAGGINAMESN